MKNLERVICLVAVAVIVFCCPVFFHRYPSLRFYWGIISAIGIGIQAYRLARNQANASKDNVYAMLLLLSVCMAYDVGNWEVFVNLFPAAANTSPLKVVMLISLFMIGGGIVAASVSKLSGRRRHFEDSHSAADSREYTAASSETDRKYCHEPKKRTAGSRGSVNMVARKNKYDKKADVPMSVGETVGQIFGILLMTAAFIGAAYISVKNEELLGRLSMTSVNTFIRAFTWFLAFLCLAAVLLAGMLYVLWMTKVFLREIYTNRQISIDSPPFLRLLSFIIIFAAEAVFYNTDMESWFDFLQKPDELAPVLKGLLMVFLLFLLNQIMYRILYSFFSPDNTVKRMINHAADQFFKLGITVFESMLTPAPALMDKMKEALRAACPKVISWLKDYFFDADESKTGLQKKLWYPFAWGSLLFSTVSFIGTAKGMTECVFCDNLLAAYLLSFGLQLFILTFTLHLPKLLKNRDVRRCKSLFAVYAITIMCSSFFSFTYISGMTYSGTWMQDAELELMRLYYRARTQIEKASDKIYNDTVTEMTEMIVEIQNDLSAETDIEYSIDFEAIRAKLTDETMILSIVDDLAGKAAVNTAKLTNHRTTLENRKTVLENEIIELDAKIKEANTKIEEYNANISEHIAMRYGVKLESPAHDSYTAMIEELENNRDAETVSRKELETNREAKQYALSGINSLLAYIDVLENQSAGQLTAAFSEIMSAISSSSPDMVLIQKNINDISEITMSAAHMGADSNTVYQTITGRISTLKTYVSVLKAAASARQWCLFPEENLKAIDQLVSADAGSTDIAQWKASWNQVLTEAQTHLAELEAYASAEQAVYISTLYDDISQMKRSCLMDLNQIETAVGRLTGKYPVMAWFSLLLAVYLDAAPAMVSFMAADDRGTAHGNRAAAMRGAAVGANALLLCLIVYGIYWR